MRPHGTARASSATTTSLLYVSRSPTALLGLEQESEWAYRAHAEAMSGSTRRSTASDAVPALAAAFFHRGETCEHLDKKIGCRQRAPGPGSGPCSASKSRLTRAKSSSARSSVASSCVAITLVRSSAPPGGTAGCSAVLTNTPASYSERHSSAAFQSSSTRIEMIGVTI